jgi:hypothetical protein
MRVFYLDPPVEEGGDQNSIPAIPDIGNEPGRIAQRMARVDIKVAPGAEDTAVWRPNADRELFGGPSLGMCSRAISERNSTA